MVEQEISRRNFLKAGALLSGGLLISFTIPQVGGRLGKSIIPGIEGGFTPNAFLNIQPDNKITIILSHTEMGQGIWTTLPMLIAEELDADWKNITVEHAPAGKPWNHTTYGIQITGGSSTTWSEFDRYRKAGAAARILLTQAAANRWRVTPDKVKTANGLAILGDTKLSYGELATEAALLPEPKEIPLRAATDWKYVGKGKRRLDAPAKTNGSARFGMDMQLPGMLIAVVAHSPVFGGKVLSFNATRAKAVKGVKQVVQIPTGVAVLADNYWSANEGKKLLNIIWNEGEGANLNTASQMAAYKKLASTNGLPAQKQGDLTAGFAGAAKIIEAEYVFPYLAHAPMEPLNCTVKITGDSCEIWSGTQLPGVDRDNAARILGMKSENVTLNVPFLGGGFGRRATMASDFVSEAVQIAKASHQTVKMIWSREDDMKGGYYRPAYVHKLRIGTDADGMPVAWQHNIAGQSIMAGTPMAAGIKDGIDDSSVEGVKDSPYLKAVPAHYVGLHTTKEVVPVLWYRSVGNTHTGFVMETIIDELATNAGKDPLEYRRKLLKDSPRHLAALNLAAEKAGWGKKLPAGHYHGIAVHEAFKSYVAEVAEISLEGGKLKVHKVTCAIDLGLAVNPDGVRAQMESGIIFGLTMALYGELSIENGRLQQNNFYDYKIARMNEAPQIDVHIVDSKEEMGGAGEPCVPPLAPALCNAIFAATGKRIYDLPLMNHNFITA
ncbi:xanthine dehydrogenase family protein molybdopterin-binding subunit [Mucilaginibacter ginkgonis]|uniref:Xanthine dehydrogenase family protein molybdopterin-binding subunit n=1 Tax=Mucilaginibacter ginkgonis TaxID=2682091 RepID=A0A6I4HX13_9SPHI|nr:xanthine dehydrogenase family protein molybdopterin-binding subunit [Mucilaginibacter ginkgonis]QQL51252.1 xanthine dehydrogenase family protein molybdopterin-binding subunit [Mucilaginibacter ginkgonis]